jgi:protein-S-isoprenylcysteine O-methyltransferase Ste14
MHHARQLMQNLVGAAIMSVLLFVPAGTLQWPAAWVFLATIVVLGTSGGMWLAKSDPGLFAERARPLIQDDQPPADKRVVLAFVFAAIAWILTIALDKRNHLSNMSPALQVLGWATLVIYFGLTVWVMHENSFAAPVVKLQTERGHRVISTGPYAIVRHPMYSVAILFFVGSSFLLGSWCGVATSVLCPLLCAIRIRIEERVLMEGLPGYADYAAKVRYRLVPGIW